MRTAIAMSVLMWPLLAIFVAPASAQYVLRNSTMNSGGGPMGSSSFRHGGSVGQITVGRMSGGAYRAALGFWNNGYGPVSDTHESPAVVPPPISTLLQSSPNPSRGSSTDIRFAIGLEEHSGPGTDRLSHQLALYDVQGRLVRTLVNQPLPAGHYSFRWDNADEAGRPVANGIYFYTLQTRLKRLTKQLVVLR